VCFLAGKAQDTWKVVTHDTVRNAFTILAVFIAAGSFWYTWKRDNAAMERDKLASQELHAMTERMAVAQERSESSHKKLSMLSEEKLVLDKEVLVLQSRVSDFYHGYGNIIPAFYALQEKQAEEQKGFFALAGRALAAEDEAAAQTRLKHAMRMALANLSRNPRQCGELVEEYKRLETKAVTNVLLSRTEIAWILKLAAFTDPSFANVRRTIPNTELLQRLGKSEILEIEIGDHMALFPFVTNYYTPMNEIELNMRQFLAYCERYGVRESVGAEWVTVNKVFEGELATSRQVSDLVSALLEDQRLMASINELARRNLQALGRFQMPEDDSSGLESPGFMVVFTNAFAEISRSEAIRLKRYPAYSGIHEVAR